MSHAGILDDLFGGPDAIARGLAKEFVADLLSKPNEAVFEKINIVEKDGPAYLFHAPNGQGNSSLDGCG
jgi:hypothetical protein